MVEHQKLCSESRPTAISWTGGKDCNLALLVAWRDPRFCVTSLVVFRPEDATFRAHPLAFAELQAESLGLPLHHVIIPRGGSYKESYVSGMQKLRVEYGIEVIATGDMDLVGAMRRNWIQECGEEAGIDAFLPLWKADRLSCLHQLLAERFCVVFSCVKSPWFDSSWIGRVLDESVLETMMAMASTSQEGDFKPLDLGGERGEYHTMCLDGPLFSRAVPLLVGEPSELDAQPGQKPGERWWTLGVPLSTAWSNELLR